MLEWLLQLRPFLLKTRRGKGYTQAEIDEFCAFIVDIQLNWQHITGLPPGQNKKLRLLSACGMFAQRFKMLADVSESCIESCHAALYRHVDRHINKSRWVAAQLSASLHDYILTTFTPKRQIQGRGPDRRPRKKFFTASYVPASGTSTIKPMRS